MSTDWTVYCLRCLEFHHLGQRFAGSPYVGDMQGGCFGYGSHDEDGRLKVSAFINKHLGHDLRISDGCPAGFKDAEEGK